MFIGIDLAEMADGCRRVLHAVASDVRLPRKRRPEFVRTTTACYRGYIGTWEIRDDRLFLVGIERLLRTPEGIVDATMGNALPWVKDGALAANWVSDGLRCPEGRLICYAHAMFQSRYERDRVFEFEKGRLL